MNALASVRTNSSGRRLLMTGQAAIEAARTVLLTHQGAVLPNGTVLRPGTLWRGNCILISASSGFVVFLEDDKLYEIGASDFVRNEYLEGLSAGAAKAKGMVHLAKLELTFLCGIFVPWYLLLALPCGKAGLFYSVNKNDVKDAHAATRNILESLKKLQRAAPTFADVIIRGFWDQYKGVLLKGITAEDIAFLLGRLIKAFTERDGAMTFWAVVSTFLKTSGLVSLSHSPAIALHALEALAKRVKASPADIVDDLEKKGLMVSANEKKLMMRELSASAATHEIVELSHLGLDLFPIAKRLSESYGRMFT